jgi:glutathione S-transferase
MASQKPKLIYFNGRGRAEVARLIFADKGIDYVDERVSDGFAQLKPTLPFGQLPVLEVNGIVIPQSVAITRYLAREHGLYGKNSAEGALADAIIDGLHDMRAAVDKGVDDAAKAEARRKWLSHFERLLKNNNGGNGFLVGNDITFADYWMFNSLESLKSIDATILNDYHLISALHDRIGARPGIAAWLKSRPVTQF